MGYVILIREADGSTSYINKIFSSEAEAYTFVKSHSSGIADYTIATEEEFRDFLQSQQQSKQQRGGYQQNITIIDDQREEEPETQFRSKPLILNYQPKFVRPAFAGYKKINRRL